MRHPFLFCTALLGVSVLFSCKKHTEDPASISSYAPLIPATSGWEKVGMIKYSYKNLGYTAYNDIRPMELQKVGNEIFVLYAEDFRLSGSVNKQFYKARFTPGSADTAVTTKLPFGAGTDREKYYGLWKQQFIPGSYTAMCLKYFANPSPNNYLGIVNEANQEVSNHFIGHASLRSRTYSNGDVIAGAIDYSDNAELDFYNKATNSWTFVKGTSNDTMHLVDFTPFRLGDGSLWAFNVYSKNDKTFLAMANPTGALYPTPLYLNIFRQPMPELDFDYFGVKGPTIIGAAQDDNSITVVLGYTFVSSQPTKLAAYKWTKGTNTFATLYKDVPVTYEEAEQLRNDEARCLTDGTVYKWWQVDNTGSILVANAGGVKHRGQIAYPNYVFMSGITWLDGAFYGASYLYSDQQDTDHKMRMDIIKLKE